MEADLLKVGRLGVRRTTKRMIAEGKKVPKMGTRDVRICRNILFS